MILLFEGVIIMMNANEYAEVLKSVLSMLADEYDEENRRRWNEGFDWNEINEGIACGLRIAIRKINESSFLREE